ncbi:MAG: hypothetical protein ACI9OE_002557 [Mariniflexile sp.]|jgi:hypothetical protein
MPYLKTQKPKNSSMCLSRILLMLELKQERIADINLENHMVVLMGDFK